MHIRQPIVTVLGHVDHGKTTILDRIRRTTVQKKEAGGITQHIGATEVPIDVIKNVAKPILQKFPVQFRIPGLLFIDTPGHEAFANLRRRGGSIADIAVLVVDVTQGFQPQTYEAIDILREFKVPFVVAANKIDLIRGWKPFEDAPVTESMKRQKEDVINTLDMRIYSIVSQLAEVGFASERFDRVRDFTREVVIIPVSGKTGEGLPELLLYLAGLSQKFLKKRLEIHPDQPGRGTILEVREDQGLGTTITVILYDGTIRRGDTIVFGARDGVKTTRVRALLRPKPLDEIRDPRDKFRNVEEVHAAAGIKIAAPNLEGALPGSPVIVARGKPETAIELVKQELASIEFETEERGLIVKGDTLGSLEALVRLLRERGYSVKKAEIGSVSRKDVMEAHAVRQVDRYLGVILAFNVDVDPLAEEEATARNVPIIKDKVIYRIIEQYEEWRAEEREREKKEKLEKLILPGKVEILPGYVFRRSDPAIVGVRVLSGIIKPKYPLTREDGKTVGEIKSIQSEKRSLSVAKAGDEVAIAIVGPMVGRHIFEGDILYVDVPKEHAREIRKLKHLVTDEIINLLGEIERIQRKRQQDRKAV